MKYAKIGIPFKSQKIKALHWAGSSKKDLISFPRAVCHEMSYALYVAQKGETHRLTKPFKGFGSGIYDRVSVSE